MQQLQAYLLLLIVFTVQEVMTIIWEPQTSLDSGQGPRTATPWGQTGSSYESRATITPQQRHEEVTGAERAVSPLLLVLGVSTGAPSSSGPFLQGHMLFQPSSAPPGLTAPGLVDRETPRLPQEATDNGADVSGGARATQGDVVGESARADLATQHAPTTHAPLGTEEQRAPRGDALPHAHTLTSKPVGGSSRDAHVAVDTATHTNHAPYIYPTWSATPVFSSSPPLVSLLTSGVPATPGVPGTNLTQRGRLVDGLPGSSQTPTWRGQRSTDQPHPDISQSVTSDPLHASAQPRWKGLDGSVRTNEPALSPRPGRTDRSPLMTRYVSLVPTQSPDSSLIGLRTDVLPHSTPTYTRSANTRAPNEVARTEGEQRAIASSDARTLPHTGKASTAESFPTVTPSENIPRVTRDTGGTTTSTGRPLSITALPSPQEVAPESTAVPRRACSPNVTAAMGSESESTDADARAPVARPSSPRPTAMRGDSASHTVASSPDAPRTHVDTPSSATPTSGRTAAHTHQYARWTDAALPNGTRATELPLSPTHTATAELKSTAAHQPSYAPTPIAWSPDAPQTYKPSSAAATSAHTAIYRYVSTTTQNALSLNTKSEGGLERGGGAVNEQVSVSIMASQSSTSGDDPLSTTATPAELPLHTVHPYRDESNAFTSPSPLDWSSTTTQAPKYFIVPDQHAATRVEYIELLLQIVLEESNVAFTAGLEKDTAAWVEPYLQKAPGFSRFLEVWSRGLVVQSVVEFRTQGALAWLGMVGSSSLLERTGLAQAVQEGRGFRGSKIVNITLGGLQGSVCDWLLRCPEGYKCVSQPHSANHSCSSVCHYDHCHNHGICTHHSGQLPVCRCLVGEHFWYMGLRCDTRMTRARLVGVCLAVLVVMVTLIAIVALVAVRRYRAILIQAKVDQTRSSYRRFNHFDELSARFWLRSWTGSADSLDNPAFTRSDELLHLRALDRTCCYHDDTLSLASTCPSNGTRLNTVFPHSSQYGWRGSMISMGECGLDSGKASDLSVCSWPVEPIQWTPFPLLQQLASHRTATVRASRPRSYCEGMELVDLGKSWTA